MYNDGGVCNRFASAFSEPVKILCLYNSSGNCCGIFGVSDTSFRLLNYSFSSNTWQSGSSSTYNGFSYSMLYLGALWANSEYIFGAYCVPCSGYGDLTDLKSYLDSLSSVNDVPELAPDVLWPQQDLAIDQVKNPTWDDAIASDVVIPGEVADTGTIAIEDTPTDSVPIPGTIPDNPAIPDDPAIPDNPDKPADPADETVTDEEIGTLPDTAAAAGDITKLFPFCIPFDLVALIKGMKAEEKAPVWHFEYYFKDINYTFDFTVDMTEYETYIKIFRAGIVIFWIIALMFITIRYSSGIAKD